MSAKPSLIPPWETAQALLESPGVIRQAELRLFVSLRYSADDIEKFTELSDSLAERFETGWLIEMGSVSMYRDHTGVIVIGDTGELSLHAN